MTLQRPTAETLSQYAALTAAAGLVDLSQRAQIEISGADAAALLHNLCTNDINGLSTGKGCEAFLTNAQGKIVGYVLLFREASSLIADTSAGQAAALIEHLDRYIIREDVQLTDRSDLWSQWLLSGSQATATLSKVLDGQTPSEPLQHCQAKISGKAVRIRRVDFISPCSFAIVCDAGDAAIVSQALQDAGATVCGAEAFDIARVEAGTPWFGRDITQNNLPQEIARDEQAISFTKGCYLGQETVARIDSLGHVNRTLVGLKISSDNIPDDAAEVMSGEKVVGQITSAVYSPRLETPLALAYVRRGHEAVGTQLVCLGAVAEVVNLPLV